MNLTKLQICKSRLWTALSLSARLVPLLFSTKAFAAGEGDDYPDTFSTAAPVSVGTIYDGAIGDDDDVDMISFSTDMSTSAYTINVTAVDDMPLYIKVYSESSPNVIDNGSFTVASARTMARYPPGFKMSKHLG